MQRANAVFALWCGICAFLLARPATGQLQSPGRSVSPQAVWNPRPEIIAGIRAKCGAVDPAKIGDCFYAEMQSAGASAEATGFARNFAPRGIGYLRAFRETGRVDIAYVEYVFRANELEGVLLVNGSPPIVDVDDPNLLSQEDLRKNGGYNALVHKFPNCSTWPADRYDTSVPTMESSANDGQNFKVKYLLLNGCHACAKIGEAVVSFHFDSSGRYRETKVLAIRPGGAEDEDRPVLQRRPGTIHASVGKTFTIKLAANPASGYSWWLAVPLNVDILKYVSNVYQPPASGNVVAPGNDVWTFEAVGKGATEIVFEYVRPFETNPPSTRKSHFWVEVD
ncbi:MAG: protease inhibitor I42 family protein [Candidatus Acidiferrales bacterium]